MRLIAITITTLTILLGVGAAARAGDADIDFANGLLEELGYADLAVEIFQKITGDTRRSEEVRASAHLNLSELYMKMIEEEGDSAKKQDLYSKAEQHLKNFKKLQSGKEKSSRDILLKVAGIQRQKGMARKRDAAKEGATEEQKRTARREARESFGDALRQYEVVEKELKKEYEKAKEEKVKGKKLNEIMEAYGTAWFERLRTAQMRAEIMPEGSSERQRILKKLIEEIEDDFTPEFFEWGLEYYGRLLKGVCLRTSGRYKKALECIDLLLEDMEEYRLMRDLEDLGRRAYMQKADVYADWARADKDNARDHNMGGIKAIDDLLKEYSRLKHSKSDLNYYCLCLKTQAEAYAEIGEYEKALENVGWVFKNGSSGWKNLVSGLVEKWIEKAKTGTAFFMMGRRGMAEKNYAAALDAYREGLRIADREELAEYEETAWHHMGICYYNMGHFYEAGIAFAKLGSFGGDLKQKGLLLQTQSYGKQFNTSRDSFDRTLWLEAMLDFVGKFPDEEPDMDYLIAEQYRVLGDFGGAGKWYSRTREKSRYYKKAQYRLPKMLWRKYRKLKEDGASADEMKLCLLQASRGFKDYLRWSKQAFARETDPAAKGDLLKKASSAEMLTAQAALALMKLAEEAGDAEETGRNAEAIVDILAGFEERYPGVEKKTAANAQLMRIQALAKLLDVENVEKELDRLMKGKSKLAVKALAITANTFLEAAETERNSEKKKEYNSRAAELFEKLLNYDPDQKASMYIWVGDQLLEMGRLERAVKMYREFLDKFGEDEGTKEKDILQTYYRLAGCHMKLKQYDDVIEYVTRLLADPEWEKDWNVSWMYIDALVEKGRGRGADAGMGSLVKARELMTEIGKKIESQSREWYRTKLRIVGVDIYMEDYREALNRVEMIDQLYTWNDQEGREEVAVLLEEHTDKVKDPELNARWTSVIERLRKPVEVPVL